MNIEKAHKRKSLCLLSIFSLLFCVSIGFSQCSDDNSKEVFFDPLQSVEITSFTPDSGNVMQQMLIYGSNFGIDTSLIKVFINGQKAPIISSNGSCIYALVPSRAGSGNVSVQIGKDDQIKEAVSRNIFNYIFKPTVSTVAGFTDRDGNSSNVDGDLAQAQFFFPMWLNFDKNKNLFLMQDESRVRMINNVFTKVETKFTNNNLNRIRTLSFSPNNDTLYVTNDNNSDQSISTVIATNVSNFTEWNTLVYSKQCNGGAANPVTGEYFYNSYTNGSFWQYDRATQSSHELYKIGDNGWEANVTFAPSGNFAYIIIVNKHYILKADYNWVTNTLNATQHFVGGRAQAGYADGIGTGARFSTPYQGVFDENDNFYVCDRNNHCIRKITPDGVVSTFAGRPNSKGYADGPLRDAQFNEPCGIAYDKDDGTFYIADRSNHRIRMIKTE